jgi:nitrate/nitrite-specific signal transduction histidine kinase
MGSVIVEVAGQAESREGGDAVARRLVLVLLTSMLIAMRVSRRITLPVLEMNNAIRRIGEGHLDTHIAGNQVQELDALASGINDMPQYFAATH